MTDCRDCGMEMDDEWSVCPKCDTPAGHSLEAPMRGRSKRQHSRRNQHPSMNTWHTVDVGHHGYAAADIPHLLDDARSLAVMQGCELLRIIHGYGSAGTGGILRDAVHRHCRQLLAGNAIRSWKGGEDLRWPLPSLFADADRSDAGNHGVTLLAL